MNITLASILWIVLLAVATGAVIASWSCWSRGYFQFLFMPWRVFVFFGLLLVGNALNTKYSVLTETQYGGVLIVGFTMFLTAPWAVGTLIRTFSHRIPNFFRVFVAFILLLAPAAVAELYMYCITGHFRSTWPLTALWSTLMAVIFGILLSLVQLRESPRFIFQFDDWRPTKNHLQETAS